MHSSNHKVFRLGIVKTTLNTSPKPYTIKTQRICHDGTG